MKKCINYYSKNLAEPKWKLYNFNFRLALDLLNSEINEFGYNTEWEKARWYNSSKCLIFISWLYKTNNCLLYIGSLITVCGRKQRLLDRWYCKLYPKATLIKESLLPWSRFRSHLQDRRESFAMPLFIWCDISWKYDSPRYLSKRYSSGALGLRFIIVVLTTR